MPPDEEEENNRRLRAIYPVEFSRTFAGQMEEINRQMERLRDEIVRSLGIPMEEALRALGQAMRSNMPDAPHFPNEPYFVPSNDRPMVHRVTQQEGFSGPYGPNREAPLDPAANTEPRITEANMELLRIRAAAMSVYRHDVRPIMPSSFMLLCHLTGCNEEAIARCYTIGCGYQNQTLCAKHLHEDHDHRLLPEGVPHE